MCTQQASPSLAASSMASRLRPYLWPPNCMVWMNLPCGHNSKIRAGTKRLIFFFLNITLLSLKRKVKNVQSNQFVHSLLQRETGESSATRSPQLHLIKPHNKLSSVSGVSAPVRQYKSYTYGSTAGGLKAGERAKLNSRCSLRMLGDKKRERKGKESQLRVNLCKSSLEWLQRG